MDLGEIHMGHGYYSRY